MKNIFTNMALFVTVVLAEVARLEKRLGSGSSRVQGFINAVNRASIKVQNGEVNFRTYGDKIIIVGDSGNIHVADRQTCDCPAFENGIPCYHRALHTLVAKYNAVSALEEKRLARQAQLLADIEELKSELEQLEFTDNSYEFNSILSRGSGNPVPLASSVEVEVI